jgi:hypothetical protein
MIVINAKVSFLFLFLFCLFFSSPVRSGSLDETGTFKKWRGEVNSAQKEIEFKNFRLSDQFARVEKEKVKVKQPGNQRGGKPNESDNRNRVETVVCNPIENKIKRDLAQETFQRMFVTTILITVHGWMGERTTDIYVAVQQTTNLQCPMIQTPANTTKRTKTTTKKQNNKSDRQCVTNGISQVINWA